MTMLTQTRGPSKRAPYSSERQDAAEAEAAEAHLGMIKRFCMLALTILLAGAALAGIIALRAIAVLHTLNFNAH
ncbi:MAG TPA: hypothetical protein VN831_20930 [Bradyrhizobium sp.]|nr:hypothetical protein [Bradyrhizobium sp.]